MQDSMMPSSDTAASAWFSGHQTSRQSHIQVTRYEVSQHQHRAARVNTQSLNAALSDEEGERDGKMEGEKKT